MDKSIFALCGIFIFLFSGCSSHRIEGFHYLGTNTYSCGGQTHTVQEYRHETTGMEFVLLPGGSFMMGSNDSRRTDEKPVHRVTLKPFLIGKYEVTQKVWKKVMGENPSWFKGDDRPVEMVVWDEIQLFLQKTGLELPTEAQWEYACRGGTQAEYYWGSGNIDDYAWYWDNSRVKTHPVGKKKPNAYGVYDMSGNVYECCRDGKRKYTSNAENDPMGPMGESYQICRGGSWGLVSDHCRSANRRRYLRDEREYSWGFRVYKSLH